MAIDLRDYQKYSGRTGDPYTRLGEALAKDAKAKQQREAMPKGVKGGLKVTAAPGMWAQLFFWCKNKRREQGKD